MKKAIFFDIDGTILEMDKPVDTTTIEAIKKLRENGHLAFICSGRARIMIPEDPILQIGFDGVIAACGMYGEYQGKIIFEDDLEEDLIDKTLQALEKYETTYILEGNENLYYSKECVEKRGQHAFEEKVEEMLPNNFLPLEEYRKELKISKFSCHMKESEIDDFLKEFSVDYEVLCHNKYIAEFVGKGHSKGSGIQRMCEHLGISMEDTIAFGDSVNDVEMLKSCKVGVVMGNGSEIARQHADYITDEIGQGGIYNACVHLGLF